MLGKWNLGGKSKVGCQWATHECTLVQCQFCFCISVWMSKRWIELEIKCSCHCGCYDGQVSVKGGCEGFGASVNKCGIVWHQLCCELAVQVPWM